MNDLDKNQQRALNEINASQSPEHMPKMEMLAMGVATGVAATVIVQTGKGLLLTLSRNPLFMFGVGIITGCYAHKYRKEIISVSRYSADQSRDYIVRQKQHLQVILKEREEKANDRV